MGPGHTAGGAAAAALAVTLCLAMAGCVVEGDASHSSLPDPSFFPGPAGLAEGHVKVLPPTGLNRPTSEVIKRIQLSGVSVPFSFAIVADTRPPGTRVFAAMRTHMLRQANPRPAFVIVNGDFIGDGLRHEFVDYARTIDAFGLPVLSVIGNHEIWEGEGLQHYRRIFGAEDFHLDVGGCRFVAVNNSSLAPKGSVAGFLLTRQRLRWIRDLVRQQQCTFVIMHVPPYMPSFYGYPLAPYDHDFFRGPLGFVNAPALAAMMQHHHVRMGIFAHSHSFANYTREGVRYLVSGGGGAEIGARHNAPPHAAVEHHYVVVTVHDKRGSHSGQVYVLQQNPLRIFHDQRYDFASTF